MSHIRVGMTEISPAVEAPTIETLILCASVDGVLQREIRLPMECVIRGRYLVIMLEKYGYLTLCEVEIYEGDYNYCSKQSFCQSLKITFQGSSISCK